MFHFYNSTLLQIFVTQRQLSAAFSFQSDFDRLPHAKPANLLVLLSCLFVFLFLSLSVSQLAEARDRTLQRVNRAADYKELKGKDPSSAELVKKIEQVNQ